MATRARARKNEREVEELLYRDEPPSTLPSPEDKLLYEQARGINKTINRLRGEYQQAFDSLTSLDWVGLRAKYTGTPVSSLVGHAMRAVSECRDAMLVSDRLWEQINTKPRAKVTAGDVESYHVLEAEVQQTFIKMKTAVLTLHETLSLRPPTREDGERRYLRE